MTQNSEFQGPTISFDVRLAALRDISNAQGVSSPSVGYGNVPGPLQQELDVAYMYAELSQRPGSQEHASLVGPVNGQGFDDLPSYREVELEAAPVMGRLIRELHPAALTADEDEILARSDTAHSLAMLGDAFISPEPLRSGLDAIAAGEGIMGDPEAEQALFDAHNERRFNIGKKVAVVMFSDDPEEFEHALEQARNV